VLEWVLRLSNQLPPRLKAILNLAISATLFFVAIPLVWVGVAEPAWESLALGLGMFLLAVFNLFT
jgi:hypothetical protein